MSKHTPGPWQVEIDNRTDVHGIYYVAGHNIRSAGGGEVVGVEGICCGPDDEANARLIAAAPDLLAALKKARDEINGMPRSLGYDFTHLPEIDAALSKAEGSE